MRPQEDENGDTIEYRQGLLRTPYIRGRDSSRAKPQTNACPFVLCSLTRIILLSATQRLTSL